MTPSLPRVEQPEFQGPVDLLVDEVRRQNVAVEQIDMAPLAARFLEYVRLAAERNVDLDIEWLHMAATLINWKSRSLLPQDPREEDSSGRDSVPDELIELIRRHRKEAAAQLAEQKRIEETRLRRPPDPLFALDPPPEDAGEAAFTSVWDLIHQARELARWAAEYRGTGQHWRETFDVTPETITVAQMSAVLCRYLSQAEALPVDALPLLLGQPTRAHTAGLFLGLLEMARANEISLEQPEGGEEIWVFR